MATKSNERQNLTVQLSKETIRKAKIIAAKRGTSVSQLVAREIDKLAAEDYAYERAKLRALARMKQGFHLGGGPYYKSRDELHER